MVMKFIVNLIISFFFLKRADVKVFNREVVNLYSGEEKIFLPDTNLKKGSIKVYGNITLDDSQKEIFEKGDRGFHLEINSGTIEMKNNKVTALVE